MSKDHDVKIGTTDDGKPLRLNVGRLLVSRALITSTSGGGKSYLLRKIVEEVSATTQTIVIDPEGEFASLREVRDMVLVGPDGDLPAEPAAAGLLCRRLMELNLSAVIDVSELTPVPRRQFVASFCGTMVDLPRSLWRPCFVVIDEVHEFCPLTKDRDYVSAEAISLLFSKGRKRGYAPIVATQRVSNVSPNITAEAKNRFIGQTTYDNDQHRAANFLGFGKDRWPELRDLSPPGREGEFFAVGPALSARGVVKFRGGEVRSNHPRPGQGAAPEPPAPSKAIRSVLGELADLGKKAEQERVDLATSIDRGNRLTARVAELERALDAARAVPGKRDPAAAGEARQLARQVTALRKGLEDAMKTIEQVTAPKDAPVIEAEAVQAVLARAAGEIVRIVTAAIGKRAAEDAKVRAKAARVAQDLARLLGTAPIEATVAADDGPANPPPDREPTVEFVEPPRGAPTEGLNAGQQAIIDTVAMLNDRGIVPDRECVARWLNLHPKGGTYSSNLKALRDGGYMDGLTLSDDGLAAARTKQKGLPGLLAALDNEQKRQMIRVLDESPTPMSRDGLAEALGVHPKGGTYSSNLGWLRTMKVVTTGGSISLTAGARK